jgi:CheY-like chemotaxis protein
MSDAKEQKSASSGLWMVLEDDHALRSLLTEMFKLWGRTALTFPDGFRAAAWLDAIEAGEMKDPLPEVALMDIRVPGPLGPEIAKRMREIPATAHIPVVIMTAYRLDTVEQNEIMNMARPDGFIHKGDMLFDDIQTTLDRVVREAREKVAKQQSADDASQPPESPKAVELPAAESVDEPQASEPMAAPPASD